MDKFIENMDTTDLETIEALADDIGSVCQTVMNFVKAAKGEDDPQLAFALVSQVVVKAYMGKNADAVMAPLTDLAKKYGAEVEEEEEEEEEAEKEEAEKEVVELEPEPKVQGEVQQQK